ALRCLVPGLLLPRPVEGTNNPASAGAAEIAAFLVPAEIDQDQPAARPQLVGALQEDRLPIGIALAAEGGELRPRGAHGLDMVGDVAGLGAEPMHGGGGEAKVEAAAGQDLAVERRSGEQRIDAVDRRQA